MYPGIVTEHHAAKALPPHPLQKNGVLARLHTRDSLFFPENPDCAAGQRPSPWPQSAMPTRFGFDPRA
jgi:hypothetical protein